MIQPTQRQRLLDAIKARLGGVTVLGGYQTNAGFKVHEWRDPQTQAFTKAELPAIWIRDPSDEINHLDSATHEHTLTVEIGAVCSGDATESQARSMEADIMAAIGEDPTFGGLCHYCQPGNTTLEVRQLTDRASGVRVQLQLAYRTPAFDAMQLAADPT